jgi:hypothetical protein
MFGLDPSCQLGDLFVPDIAAWRPPGRTGDGAGHFFGFFSKQLSELVQELSVVLRKIFRDMRVGQQPFDVSEAESQIERLGGIAAAWICPMGFILRRMA